VEFLKQVPPPEQFQSAINVLKVMLWYKLILLIVYLTPEQEEFVSHYQPTALVAKQPQLPLQLLHANNATQDMV